MNKSELNAAVLAAKEEMRQVLETVFAELNQGQQKKLIRNETVKELFDRYHVAYEE